MIEALVFLGVVAVVAAVQVPLLQQRWRRLENERLASLPAGAFYAGPARAEGSPGAGEKPVPGELVLDKNGVSFTPKREAPPGSSIAWAKIASARLRPVSTAPLAGSLELSLIGGSKQSYVVQRCESLADALSHLPERL